MEKYFIFYHIFLFGNWEVIVKDQLDNLRLNGLLEKSEVKIGIVYDSQNNINVDMCKKIISNYINCEVIYVKHTSSCAECDTLNEMHKFSIDQTKNVKILYIHTKGVTQYLSEREIHVWNWRKMMEYFLIDNWNDCIDKLNNGFDCCGINYQNHAATIKGKSIGIKIFNGNFFWVNSDYLKKLDNSIIWEHRYSAENWVLSSEHNAYSPFNSQPSIDLYYKSINDYKK